jgi:hypothetical protein
MSEVFVCICLEAFMAMNFNKIFLEWQPQEGIIGLFMCLKICIAHTVYVLMSNKSISLRQIPIQEDHSFNPAVVHQRPDNW